ncbi:hypothetical protein TSAR_004528 [Trichomalopsis sarcophagae]|uniref:Uncharacterized protein n=1 Tax=Trichomalopsis sarcophagae TaxID=543379 RepID=A0A232F5Z6_9HYME|nr:hypothetical protein TSAR_004528 [Trichomalopsis sarcophagae]
MLSIPRLDMAFCLSMALLSKVWDLSVMVCALVVLIGSQPTLSIPVPVTKKFTATAMSNNSVDRTTA